MICFPNAKINLGLNVLSKRADGFHNIETVLYPIPIRDALEFLTAGSFKLTVSGFYLEGPKENNLIYKAWNLLHEKYDIPPLRIHLHKAIPTESGLGGGSADAAFFLKLVNTHFNLGIGQNEMKTLTGQLGSDCPFFINNKVSLSSGKGEILQPIKIDLKGKYMVVIQARILVSTHEAYRLIKPKRPEINLSEIISKPINEWKTLLINDFEEPLFKLYPEIGDLKTNLYKNGAVYASMTGSGSAVFGLFKEKPFLKNINANNYLWSGKL
jgi:4-diphosphocytidyl-2-C-methyl-D-erythritol kinase